MRALLIVEHGSREPEAAKGLESLVEAFRREGGFRIVERAFLELAEPSIPEGVERCVRAGAAHIVVVPYFLEKGRHVAQDIPRLLEEARAKHPGVRIEMTEPVGAHPKMVEIVKDRIEKAVGS